MLKRLFDIVCSFSGLILLSPIFLILAVCIKLDSRGPIVYRQVRVGLKGKLFSIFKFRTMFIGSDRSSRLTVGADPRVTRIGRFLRKSKLDELPQLLNVLIGDMSLVGPRPEVKEFMDLYPEDIKEMVLSVRPGITDMASLSMVDENTILGGYPDARKAYIEVILPMKQSYYVNYVKEHSLLGDLKIIALTFSKIIFR